jgi:hypothetical protein
MDSATSTAGYGRALLAYAIAQAAFLLIPPFLLAETGVVPGFTWQETLDLATPVVVVGLLALAFRRGGGTGWIPLVLLACVWVAGQGIHLAANGIRDAFSSDQLQAFDQTAGGQLAHWLDEVLSHWVWHGAWVALVLLLAFSTLPSGRARGGIRREGAVVPLLAGGIHGFTWFVVTVEGLTATLGIPAAILFTGLGFMPRRAGGSARVTALFLLATGVIALIAYAGWAAINCGQLPEFTKWTGPIACGAPS